jgi:putative drug exporter of the RND superfamily
VTDALARLAVRRPRRILIVAGAVFLLAAAFGGPVVSILKSENSDFQDPKAPNQQVLRTIEAATGQSASFGVAALVPSTGDVRSNRAAQQRAAQLAARLSSQLGFQRSLDYPTTHLPELVSRDGRRTLVLAAFANREDSVRAVARIRASEPGVLFGGVDLAFSEINKRTSSDLARAETLAFPILLLLSFWVFRGLIAAALPLLVGGFAIVATFLLLRIVDQFAGLSIFALNLVTGMGLGLGIDYSLFVLARYREELAGGAQPPAAILATLRTAGRTVLYSSLTVAGALACMLVFPLRFLYSMGVGGALVALAAGAVSLLVLPAVLLVLGSRINALAPARLQRRAARSARAGGSGGWYALARGVMRRPGLVALITAGALIVVALPALRVQLTPADAHVLPASSQPRVVAEALTNEFAVDPSESITMLVRAPRHTEGGMVASIERRARLLAGSRAAVAPPRFIGRRLWEIEVQPSGVEGSSANQLLVKRLRALSSPPQLLVGGGTAWFVDQKAAIASHLPLALVILALVTAGFLFVMTGSVVLPAVALAMNLLTVAVGAGLLVLVFQDGHLHCLFGFTPIGGLEESNLVLLFVIAFALSTDYGVFLFGRIKEAYEQGLAPRDAVAHGLERTGRLVTAAALLFCVALGAFVTSHIFFVKQLGVGAPLAVAIDATVVRALLVPAIMGRLGALAWWAPRPLRRLHAHLGPREEALGEVGLTGKV